MSRLAPIAALVWALLVPTLASASAGVGPGTHDWAIKSSEQVGFQAQGQDHPKEHRQSAHEYSRNTSDYSLASRGGAGPVRVGQAGERAVRGGYNIGPQTRIAINGRGRIPDGLTNNVLSEVKNVQRLSFSRQLRDFADFAGQTGRRFDLFVRPNTRLSRPLQEAVSSGRINLRFIPE